MNCQMLLLLQILYLKFQNSLSEHPILTGIRTFQNGKILPIIKNFWRSLSSQHLKNRSWSVNKHIQFFCCKLTFKIFFSYPNLYDLVVISLVYLNDKHLTLTAK